MTKEKETCYLIVKKEKNHHIDRKVLHGLHPPKTLISSSNNRQKSNVVAVHRTHQSGGTEKVTTKRSRRISLHWWAGTH